MSKPEDVLEIEDIAAFEILNNRFRQRILRELVDPKPVKELAEGLGVPVTRLYYHVNQLLGAGLIRVVEERKVGAILEKVFQTTARSFRPGARLLQSDRPPAEMARIGAAVVLDPARLDAEAFLIRHFEAGAPVDDPGTFGRAQGRLSRAQAEDLTRRLHELLEEFDEEEERGEDGVEFSLSVIFVPLADQE
ncbi:MAG TPA: helix-turn-helix domain-containing protein [Acidimicrobiia bacterium]|nr:helix-turn-helix domain-containing protein [Acidimicrobiia bacterium]